MDAGRCKNIFLRNHKAREFITKGHNHKDDLDPLRSLLPIQKREKIIRWKKDRFKQRREVHSCLTEGVCFGMTGMSYFTLDRPFFQYPSFFSPLLFLQPVHKPRQRSVNIKGRASIRSYPYPAIHYVSSAQQLTGFPWYWK